MRENKNFAKQNSHQKWEIELSLCYIHESKFIAENTHQLFQFKQAKEQKKNDGNELY